jgi:hypothetical protein
MSSDSSFPPQLKTVSIEVKDNYVVITLNRSGGVTSSGSWNRA